MTNDGGVETMVDRGILLEVIENEDWREVRKSLRELKEDLREGFERLNECLGCPANATFCSEVRRLAESYERALIATLMLRCLLNEGLKVVEDERLREELGEVMEIAGDLLSFLNQRHDLVHALMDKCKEFWGDGS
jgi:hypothetical protein